MRASLVAGWGQSVSYPYAFLASGAKFLFSHELASETISDFAVSARRNFLVISST